jgi:hypothetical protein
MNDMKFSALLLMFFVQGSITVITAYLLYRVLNGGKGNSGEDLNDKNNNELMVTSINYD